MTDLICKNTMARCQTPGMCSPHGGCRETEPVSSVWLEQLRSEFRAAVRERDQLKAENERLCSRIASMNVSGFGEAFYLVADRLGVSGARPVSPMQVFTSEVLPALDSVIKDAGRYRWLRDPDHCEEDFLDGPADNIVVGSCGGEDILWSDALDSAVDAAMSKEG